MPDETISARIERLVAEEHELRSREQRDSDDEAALAADKTRLDDVAGGVARGGGRRRRRRAGRAGGGDPESAGARDADTVEHYLQ